MFFAQTEEKAPVDYSWLKISISQPCLASTENSTRNNKTQKFYKTFNESCQKDTWYSDSNKRNS